MWSESDHKDKNEMAMNRTSGDSAVIPLDERVLEAAAENMPTMVNVSKSTRVHIGPKIEIKNIAHTEAVKGRFLGLELISPQNAAWVRCSSAVFVCWTLVVVCALSFFIFHYQFAKRNARLPLDLNETWYLRRGAWQAMPEYSLEMLEIPVPFVLIGHSALEYCSEIYSCIKNVLAIQSDHQRRGWVDIGPNYLVGGNGLIFEGRGANILGAMVKGWNRIGISIMFLGDYRYANTTEVQYDHIQTILDNLIKKGVLKHDYVVYGHCQVSGSIVSPGPKVMDTLGALRHWNPANKTLCIR